jgi:hypothetical protein
MTSYPGLYPVVEERQLAVVPAARLGARRRRDPEELPPRPPGTLLVFDVDGRYRLYPEPGRLRGTEPHVVEASSVATVDMRPRMIVIEVTLGSSVPRTDFQVRVGFRCRVLDAAIVAQDGVTDLVPILRGYLDRDRKLIGITSNCVPSRLDEARRRVQSHLTSYCVIMPPEMPGMELTLATVEVNLAD